MVDTIFFLNYNKIITSNRCTTQSALVAVWTVWMLSTYHCYHSQ